MVHIPFDSRSVSYDDYIFKIDQIGGGDGAAAEGSYPTYTYYRGNLYQRGYGRQTGAGMGDILRHLWRMLLPVVKKAGKAVAKETVDTGGRILEKIDKGENIKEAVIGEGKKGIDNLLTRGGMSKQFGTGLKKRRSKKRIIPKHHTIIGKSIKLLKPPNSHIPSSTRKKHRQDLFGLF